MFPARTPAALKWLLPHALWRMPSDEASLFITFDDGPNPQVTPWVLDTLAAHEAKGSFFLIGRNAAEHPAILKRIRDEGHAVGNHTWEHLNGWRTPLPKYLESIARTQVLTGTRLFRPPYGRITWNQSSALNKDFRVVMWDVLSSDFAVDITGERCSRNVVRNARPGSIIVFHDSLKAEGRLRYALPRVLEHFAGLGYRFRALPENGVTEPPK
jgi:peptidoglycan-N-acetylglucosamine deacetylase